MNKKIALDGCCDYPLYKSTQFDIIYNHYNKIKKTSFEFFIPCKINCRLCCREIDFENKDNIATYIKYLDRSETAGLERDVLSEFEIYPCYNIEGINIGMSHLHGLSMKAVWCDEFYVLNYYPDKKILIKELNDCLEKLEK